MPTDLRHVSDPTTAPDPPLARHASLHALEYCQRLFYLEEDEEIRMADAAVYAGRELHASLAADEDGERTQLELADPSLGLVGKVDALRRRDGSLLPYEHKRGRSRRDGKDAAAWPSDRLQVIAYAVLIESATGETVGEGRVRYHADNVTVRVPIDAQARADLAEAITTARRLRESTERPPVTENDRLCVRCSLAPVCLPEEVRQVGDPSREPVRLYPPDRDGSTLHVVTAERLGWSGRRIARRQAPRRRAVEPAPDPRDRLAPDPRPRPDHHPGVEPLRRPRRSGGDWPSTSGHHMASLAGDRWPRCSARLRRGTGPCPTRPPVCGSAKVASARAKVESQHRYLLRGSRGDDAVPRGR